MQYDIVKEGRFVQRLNRFVAEVELEGKVIRSHVKNTGRLKELFVAGARCVLAMAKDPARATPCDLVGVYRDGVLVNVDSQAPNAAAAAWVLSGGLGAGVTFLRREYTWGNSRFDLYAERGEEKMLIEVKGVTLNIGGQARFPDAPTTRGVKHVQELIRAKEAGFRCAVLFVVQMGDVTSLAPNDATHPEFGDALRAAAAAGVEIHAAVCRNTPKSMEIVREIEVVL